MNTQHDWLVAHVAKPIKNAASKPFLRAKNGILRFYDDAKKTLKDDVEGEVKKENQKEYIDLMPQKH